MLILMLGLLLRGLAGPAQSLLVVAGRQNLAALIMGCTVLINAGLNVWLIPRMGITGAATATAAAFAFEAVATMVMARRCFQGGKA